MIKEKPAVLRLKVKVYLGTLGIGQSNVWDEAHVYADGKEVKPSPDLIVIRDTGVWFWEIKDWGNRKVGPKEVKNLAKTVGKIKKGTEVRFTTNDGKTEILKKKVTKVTMICGDCGFSANARKYARDHHISLIEPHDLGIHELVVKRIDKKRDLLLGVDIRIVPKGVELLRVPSIIETRDL
jgi:hypothetical protein